MGNYYDYVNEHMTGLFYFVRRCVLICLLLLSPIGVFAHSGAEHLADMKRVMPFEDVEQNRMVFKFFRLMNSYIDRPGQAPGTKFDREAYKRPAVIAEHPKFGNIRWEGKHRIWYHWGFNTDPKQFPPLVNSLNAAIDQGVITKDDLPEFWRLMTDEIAQRNRFLLNQGANAFGYGQLGNISAQQRRQLNGLVTIIYSVHILGDYQTDDIEVLAPLSRVYADISNAIDNLAGKDASNVEKAKAIKAALKKSQSSPEKYLNTLEREFSAFILSLKGEGYDYKARFKRLGYVLKGE